MSHHSGHETNHEQPSINSRSAINSLVVEWGWLLCATSWKRHLWDCTSIYVWPINSMLTTFSAPTQYDIYFFMYGNSSSYCWSEEDCCVCSQLKNLSSFVICASCMYNDTFGSQWYAENHHLVTHSIYIYLSTTYKLVYIIYFIDDDGGWLQ